MKCVAAVAFLSLQLAGSAFAAQKTSHTEAENALKERQSELRHKTPFDKGEKAFLKRLLEDKTLRYADKSDDQPEHRNLSGSDPLSTAMRERAQAKIGELRGAEAKNADGKKERRRAETKKADGKKKKRNLQYYYGYGSNTQQGATGYGYGAHTHQGATGYGYGSHTHQVPYYDYGTTYGSTYGYGPTYSYGSAYGYGYDDYAYDDYNAGDDYHHITYSSGMVYEPHVPKAEIPEKVSMVLEAFQDSRRLADPIKLTPDASYLSSGTEYLYANEPVFNVVYDTPPGGSRAVYLVNVNDRIAVASGTCTRTDPKTNYVGRAYCQLEYKFLDTQGNVEASIMAEGPITKGDINTLSITGGSGIFRRTVGTVVLEAGNLRMGSPPMFIPDDGLDLPSNYIVKMFVFMDSVDLEIA